MTFSVVCASQSVPHGRGPHVTITDDAWDLASQDPIPNLSPTTKDQLALTSGDVATNARTVDKWAVLILLECSIVTNHFEY